MLRKLTIILMSLTLCLTTIACGGPSEPPSQSRNPNRTFSTTSNQSRISEGQYPVQQATYDDGNGEYTLMLLNTPPGTPALVRTTDLQMARLTDEEIAAGKKSYLNVDNNQKSLHLTEDFKIEYVHNVTETRPDPQTGQQQTVIVRRESNFWTPFAGAIAGQVVGNLLFRPQYYVPPVYQPGVVMRGYGGYGANYNQAVEQYQSRYQAPPAAVRNRQIFRTTGRLRSPSYNQPSVNTRRNRSTFGSTRRNPSYNQPTTVRPSSPERSRSTGSGFGTSTLRQSDNSRPRATNRPSSFGSSRRTSGSSSRRSFGGSRRR